MRSRWLARVHSATAVGPLLVFVGVHLWETAAATGGRERFVWRVLGARGGALAVALETALVVVPLAVHVVLGALRARADAGSSGGYVDRGSRALQWATGAVALVFIGVHLGHTWVAKLGGAGAFGLYEALRADLSQPVYLGIYVVGLTALCLHLAQGIGAFAVTWPVARTDAGVRAWRLGGGLVAAAVWIVALNTTSHFVTGRALLFRVDPPAALEREVEP